MLSVKKLLSKVLIKLSIIGRRYYSSESTAISNTGIDVNTLGASITVPEGVYIVLGSWAFNTRTTSGTTNSAVRIIRKSTNVTIAQQRVFAAANNWNALQCACVVSVDGTGETFQVCGATSRPYTSATNNWILAVRLE